MLITRSRKVLLVLPLLVLGCASVAPSSNVVPTVRPGQAEQVSFVISGRISARHNEERTSTTLRWTHHNAEDDILLFGPLGKVVAHIQKDAHGISLDAGNQHYIAPNTEVLTQQVLGWSLPLSGMRYWVLALPSPESAFSVELDANSQILLLQQAGWTIRYTRYATTASDSLPLRMTLQRDNVQIQLLIDEWEVRQE